MLAPTVALATLAVAGAFAATSPPSPDPDPSVRPGTPITWVAYTVRLRDSHGRRWVCTYRPHRNRVCVRG